LRKLLPQVLIVFDQVKRRRQTKIMTEIGQEFHTKRMDCAEERAVECRLHFLSQIFLEQSVPGPLLHFVRRTIGEGYDNQTRQNSDRIRRTSDRQDTFGDCSGFAGTGRCDYRKIVV
jgi:hypothetical protein